MIRAAILGVGVWGPGLTGWERARPVLAGAAPWQKEAAPAPPIPSLLAPAERRRAGASVRLALTVAAEASAGAGIAPGGIAGVFATSNGDAAVVETLLDTLASPTPLVSPTQFHNSVHNAAAGYWSIATGSRAPVTCLSGHDGSFAAGLLRAAAEVATGAAPVLLVAYDAPVPWPLVAVRPTRVGFAAALVLAPVAGSVPPLGEIAVGFAPGPADAAGSVPLAAPLRDLAAANPAARSLPLLEALATGRARDLSLALFAGRVEVSVRPCSAANACAR